MKRTIAVLLAYTAMVAVSGAGVVMTDGFEAADTFAGNGWTSTDNWAISTSTWGNPGHYVWGGGEEIDDPTWDSGSIQKDTGYTLVSGDDEIVLTFDIRGMAGSGAISGVLRATVYGGTTSLGTVTYYDDGSLSPTIPTDWNDGLGSLTVDATAAVGENIIIKFEGIGGTSGTSAQRIGIDNVQVEVNDLGGIPDPAVLNISLAGGLPSVGSTNLSAEAGVTNFLQVKVGLSDTSSWSNLYFATGVAETNWVVPSTQSQGFYRIETSY